MPVSGRGSRGGGGVLTNAVISHVDLLFPSEKDIPYNPMVKRKTRIYQIYIAQYRRSGKT